MVLRAGAKRGPARPLDIAGAGAGVGAVLVLVVFVVVAGNRSGYSHVDDTISKLGASGAPGATWFTAINIVGALLIVLFAFGAHRRLPIGLTTGLLLGGVALGALLIGTVRCSGACLATEFDGHGKAARFTAVMIVGSLVAAAWAQRRRPKGWFRWVTFVCTIVNAALFVALIVVIEADEGRVGLFQRLFWASAYLWVLAASVAIILATRRRVDMRKFDSAQLQRKILRSSPTWKHAVYQYYSIRDPAGVKKWLESLIVSGLVSADHGRSTGSVTIAFSCSGLRALGVEYPLDDAFSAGMRSRAERLGDVGPSDPKRWQKPWRAGHVQALVWAEAEHPRIRADQMAQLRRLNHEGALELVGEQLANDIIPKGTKHAVEHLRFRDGISQPWVRLVGRELDDARREPGGALDDFDKWRPLAVGEFVLGERDESDDIARVPEPKEIFYHGSFVVVRKLAQNHSALRRFVNDQAKALGVDKATLAELLMGRRRDGRMLDQPIGTPESQLNDIVFSCDPEGRICPLGAHIRRANPRDDSGFGTRLAARHRLIRRGMTYSADPDVAVPPEWKDGLIFVAVNARLEDQFEFVQRRWLNDGDRQRLGTSHDPFAGSSGSRGNIVLQVGTRTLITDPLPVAVRTMGGEYFFAPSIAGLHALAAWPDQPNG